MARLIRRHADSGALAGLGLFAIAASVVLALGLSSIDLPLQQHGTPNLAQTLQNLLSVIRVRG
ncbi:hypothetical protein [Pseudomonas sp. Gutcm_11s]|uniref:hypothetical protein n=1 Tax=Pseudomonas sp. Gutcm_11s TaxID=3026088 RepID=UPI002362ED7A|nr:hypothetical protein [Pseudomonas sp. Gutcm_11s]MDD0842325.1 hypothetical protein [Pseudomonas sp. Gutcm_11s]